MKKDGHQQITGPNINIPKKQLRAQWKELLQLLQPQDVTAHIYLDDSLSYISCSAKVILTKAKVCRYRRLACGFVIAHGTEQTTTGSPASTMVVKCLISVSLSARTC
jgi:hypothetical protein